MIKSFEFYFDFGSPYTYLAHKQIRKIEQENSIKVKYMPILLGELLKATGVKANFDIPIKGKYMIKDCKLWADKHNIHFKFNNYFPINSLNLMRCAIVAERKKNSENFINKIFDSIWSDGLNLNDSITVQTLLKKLKIEAKEFLLEADELKVKEELRLRTDVAYKKGIFGSPSFLINNKVFWGQDRLEFAVKEAMKN